ncbi:MAG: FeoB-associated Cys-rich membrane protein [Anaerotignaceae bacterium]|nr:FeoB-associated Cys-rich membrane protein [Eubacterium sp.]
MLANIIVGIVLVIMVFLAIKSYLKQRKNGSCGCKCNGCINRCKDKK